MPKKFLVVLFMVVVLLSFVLISVNANPGTGSGRHPYDPFDGPTSTPVSVCAIGWWLDPSCPRPTSTPDPQVACFIDPTLPWCNTETH